MCNGFRLKVLNRMLAHKIVAPPISDDAHQVDWVSGASMMVRRQVIDDVGLMDETYFLYFEEMDFCLQAHHAGWFCWYVPASRVVHLVGQATQLTDLKQAVHKRREIYWFDARRHYFLKNFGRVHKLLADVLWTIGYGTWVLRKKLLGYPDRDPQRFWRDFIDYNFFGKNLNP
jgi:hypothetical protein